MKKIKTERWTEEEFHDLFVSKFQEIIKKRKKKNELTLNEKVINFLAKARKQKGLTVIYNSGKDILGLFHIDAQIWSKNRRTLEDLFQVCPVEFDIQKVDKEYMMQLFDTAKTEN